MRILLGATLAALVITSIVAPSALLAQQKTVRECRDEWRASTDPAKGTQKDFVAKCREERTTSPAVPPGKTPATGQVKTAKECRDEWRANKDANKKAGITQKDYVTKCRGGDAAQPTTPPASPSATAPAAAGVAKTARACRDEWRANRDANKAAGITQKDYVEKCRAGIAAAPAAPPAPSATAPAPAPAPAPSATTPSPPAPAPAPSASKPGFQDLSLQRIS